MRGRTAVTAALLAAVIMLPSGVWAQGNQGGAGRGRGAGPAGPQSLRPPAVTLARNPTDPFAAIKAGTQTPAEYQAQYRYNAAVDPADPFHNWGGNLWNQTWTGEWLAAHAKGQTFEQFWNSLQLHSESLVSGMLVSR